MAPVAASSRKPWIEIVIPDMRWSGPVIIFFAFLPHAGPVIADSGPGTIDDHVISIVTRAGLKFEPYHANRQGDSTPGLSIPVLERDAVPLLHRLREQIADAHYQVFYQDKGYGYIPDRIAIIRSDDPYEILRVQDTQYYAAGYDSRYFINKLREWDRRYGIDLIGAGVSWIEVDLVRPPQDMHALALEVAEFSPYLVTDWFGSLEALLQDMQNKHRIFLRWE